MKYQTNPKFLFADGSIDIETAMQAGRKARAEAAKDLFGGVTSATNEVTKKPTAFFGKGFVKMATVMSLFILISACSSEGPTKSTMSFVHPMNNFTTIHISHN